MPKNEKCRNLKNYDNIKKTLKLEEIVMKNIFMYFNISKLYFCFLIL